MSQSGLMPVLLCRVEVLARYAAIIFIATVSTMLSACSGESSMVEKMDSADQGSKRNVSEIVREYFPPGTELSDALNRLKKQGFEITEFTKNGFGRWPGGTVHPYQDEAHKNSALGGLSRVFTAKKTFENYLISRKEAVIRLDVIEDRVVASRGHIYIHGF